MICLLTNPQIYLLSSPSSSPTHTLTSRTMHLAVQQTNAIMSKMIRHHSTQLPANCWLVAGKAAIGTQIGTHMFAMHACSYVVNGK
jgi:hypothetical protein